LLGRLRHAERPGGIAQREQHAAVARLFGERRLEAGNRFPMPSGGGKAETLVIGGWRGTLHGAILAALH
jgi:hypothetical protein